MLSSTLCTGSVQKKTSATEYYSAVKRTIAAAGDCQAYGFDPAGNRTALVTQPSGTCPTNPSANVTSDAANRLIAEGARPYTFDANGQEIGSGNDFAHYDAEGRLTSMVRQPAAPSGRGSSCADLNGDGQDNILDLTVATNAFLTSRGQSGFDFRADLNWDGAVNIIDLSAESQGLPHACTGGTGSYTYNGDGLRTSKTENGATTSYVWDVASSLPVILQDTGGNSYAYGLGLTLQDTNGTPAWSLQDGLGSTVGTTDNSGAITSTYRYDAYGAVRSTSGSAGSTFTHDGEQTDASGLVYLRARYMDPATGRFVTQDPIPFLQRYAYVWDNPANASDPDGTCPRFIPGCDNAVFVFQFLTGTGSKNRTYGPNSRQISDVRSSPGADAVRQKFIAGGCLDTSGIPYGTARAFLDTYRHPTSTAFQVGGFANASVRNLGNGNIQISIPNDAGANSFFYHLVPNVPWSDGPLRTIHQTFEWTEPAPAACSRLPSGSKE